MIYLDNASTSYPKPDSVYRSMDAFARASGANPGRGGHRLAGEAEAVARALTSKTRLVALTHASNVTGTVHPLGEIGRRVREHGSLLLVDAAQSAGVVPIDIEADAIDLLAFTGHKSLLGPTGTGGLVVGDRAEVEPWREGGTGGDSGSPTQPLEMPHRLEGGTPNVFGIAGLREGVRIVLQRGPGAILAHEHARLREFLAALWHRDRFSWYGGDRALLDGDAAPARVGLLSFNHPGFTPDDLAAVLDAQFGIAVRAGLHCAPDAHKHLGTFPDGTTRLSVGILTTGEEMVRTAAALDQIAESAG